MAAAKKQSTKSSKKKAPKKRSLLFRIIKFCIIFGLICGFLGCLVVAGAFWYYSRTLPGIFSYNDYKPKQMSIIYDKSGEHLAYCRYLGSDFQNNNGVFITLNPSANVNSFRKTS